MKKILISTLLSIISLSSFAQTQDKHGDIVDTNKIVGTNSNNFYMVFEKNNLEISREHFVVEDSDKYLRKNIAGVISRYKEQENLIIPLEYPFQKKIMVSLEKILHNKDAVMPQIRDLISNYELSFEEQNVLFSLIAKPEFISTVLNHKNYGELKLNLVGDNKVLASYHNEQFQYGYIKNGVLTSASIVNVYSTVAFQFKKEFNGSCRKFEINKAPDFSKTSQDNSLNPNQEITMSTVFCTQAELK